MMLWGYYKCRKGDNEVQFEDYLGVFGTFFLSLSLVRIFGIMNGLFLTLAIMSFLMIVKWRMDGK